MTINRSKFLPNLFCRPIMDILIKKMHLNLLVWNLNRNYLWLAHFQNYCVTPQFSRNFRSQIENQMSEYRLLGASSLNCVVVNMNFIYLLVIEYVIHYIVVYFIKSCNYPEHDHIYLSSSLGGNPLFYDIIYNLPFHHIRSNY